MSFIDLPIVYQIQINFPWVISWWTVAFTVAGLVCTVAIRQYAWGKASVIVVSVTELARPGTGFWVLCSENAGIR